MKTKLLFVGAYFVLIQLGTSLALRKPIKDCPPIKLKHGRGRIRARIFAEFTCAKGYILAGDRYNKCTQGKWDSEPPICVRPNCQAFQKLKNGIVHQSHRGGVLNFYCLANYALEGPKQAFCVDGKWNTHMPSCLPTNITPSLSCNFEAADLCGWTQDLNHNFDWTRMKYKTPSGHLSTGPSYDHTKGPGGDGYYMYIEGSTRNINDEARLVSPTYRKETNDTCLEFYYHMYGSGIGQLRVYVMKVNETWDLKVENAVFVKEGNQGNEWWRGFIDLGPIDDQFQVVFEGVRGHSFISDIAIDDVKIIENCYGDSITSTTETYTSETTFIYDSCNNRCNTSNTQDISCSCDEDCVENNSCCPDYIVLCVLGTDSYVTETVSENYATEYEDTTVHILTTEKQVSTSSPTTMAKLPPTKSILPTSIAPLTFTSTTLRKLPTTPRMLFTIRPILTTVPAKTTTIKADIDANARLVTTALKTTKTAMLTTTPSIPVVPTKTTVYFLNDMLTLPIATTSIEKVQDIATELPTVIQKEYPSDTEVNHPVLSDKTAPIQEKPAPSNKGTMIAVLTVCFIVVGILGLVFLAKRYTSRNWMNVRRMRSGNGDSQSDVRFLTGDEVLDFRVQLPQSEY